MLVFHASCHAGDPDAWSLRREPCGKVPSNLVNDGDDNGTRTGEPQACNPGAESRRSLMPGPVPRAAEQAGRLPVILKVKDLRGLEHRKIDQASRIKHVGVGDEGGGTAPPDRVNLAKERNSDERRHVAGRAMRVRAVVADLANEAGRRGLRPLIQAREHGPELWLRQAPGEEPLDRGPRGCSRVPTHLQHEVVDRRTITAEQGIRQNAGRRRRPYSFSHDALLPSSPVAKRTLAKWTTRLCVMSIEHGNNRFFVTLCSRPL